MAQKSIRKLPPTKAIHIPKDDAKLVELVVLLANRSKSDPLFGGIKLNKLMFYCDFLAYLMLGQAITGQEYFALPNGPALRHKEGHWRTMVNRKDIAVRKEPTRFDNEREVTLALREPDVTKFSPQELDLIYRVLEAHRDKAGTDLSTLSHRFAGWALAREKETIPYPVALVAARTPTQSEIQAAFAIEESLGLAA